MLSHKPLVPLSTEHVPVVAKMINPADFGLAILKSFMRSDAPGSQTFGTSPSVLFYCGAPIRPQMWDLEIRKNHENLEPSTAHDPSITKYNAWITKNATNILEENGVTANSIEAVRWREIPSLLPFGSLIHLVNDHWHWHHMGYAKSIPSTTDVFVGSGFKAAMLFGPPVNSIRQSWKGGKNFMGELPWHQTVSNDA
ncbi:hypothetical protein LZ30DRAFT_661753 [Colletotrichum cereale]|nr:hypothetical protein LZ30DRAFT_661753 [Colletotrichum cereale]